MGCSVALRKSVPVCGVVDSNQKAAVTEPRSQYFNNAYHVRASEVKATRALIELAVAQGLDITGCASIRTEVL